MSLKAFNYQVLGLHLKGPTAQNGANATLSSCTYLCGLTLLYGKQKSCHPKISRRPQLLLPLDGTCQFSLPPCLQLIDTKFPLGPMIVSCIRLEARGQVPFWRRNLRAQFFWKKLPLKVSLHSNLLYSQCSQIAYEAGSQFGCLLFESYRLVCLTNHFAISYLHELSAQPKFSV